MIEKCLNLERGGKGMLAKRVFDVVFSLAALIALSPVFLIIAALIKLDSKGPVIFKQRRTGLNGGQFKIYKFRSMELHDEEAGRVTQARKKDPRITTVGRFIRKTSLDELPQFINVIKGDMSIVGPRPHAFEHDEIYKNEVNFYMQRYQVKPGITGLAQISGFRGETDSLDKMIKRVSVDIEYIESRSFIGDLVIVLKTPFSLFTENAY